MKKLYLFDFDGTLTNRDTMFLFLHFYNPGRYHFQLIRHLPLFVLLKMKLADAENVKKSFVSSILKGQKESVITQKAHLFFEKYYPDIIRKNALEFIQNIDRSYTESYIVTASLDIWVKPFADKLKMNLIATKAEFRDGVFTGNFSTRNCNGKEKLYRVKREINGKKFDKIIAFGDTSGDQPMLKWADENYYRFFQ